MAEGKYYDESGDFDEAQDFDREYDDAPTLGDKAQFVNRVHGANKNNLDDGKNTAGFGKFGRKNDENGDQKWGLLKKGEKDASEKPNIKGKGGDKAASLGEKENNVPSDDNTNTQSSTGKFKNAVQGVKDLKSGKVGKANGRFKKSGPLATIIAIFAVFSLSSFLGQMSLPISFMSQINETYDSISASQGLRSNRWLRWQTAKEDGKVKDCIKAHYFKADEFKVSKRQKAKLAAHNITFEEDPGGFTVIKHQKSNGAIQTIVADPSQATDGRISFEQAFNSDADPEFRNNYTEGARTWRGSVGAWFDKATNKLLNRLGVKRGVWKDFKSGKSEDSINEMRNTVAENADADSADGKARSTDIEQTDKIDEKTKQVIRDSEGNTIKETTVKANDAESTSLSRNDVQTDSKGKVTNTDGVKTKLKGIADKVGKIKNVAGIGVSVYCGIADFVGGVNAIIAAYQTMQIIKVASSLFEGIQKGMISEEDSPINEIGNSLTMRTESNYQEVGSIKRVSDKEAVVDSIKETNSNKSAMEAEGVIALYSGRSPNMSDPSVKSYNIGQVTKQLYSGLASVLSSVDTSVSAFRSCAVARLGAAAAGAAIDFAMVVGCALSAGIGCLVDFALDAASSTAISAAFSLAISTAIGFLAPFVAGILVRKIATKVAGEDLGNALVAGGNLLHGNNHRSQGGALANKEGLVAFLKEKDVIIAENARYERENRSPFDLSSKYTFFGSLANQLVPIMSSMTSITGVINSAGSIVGNSINSMMPKSSAVSAGIEAQAASDNTEKYCPDLADIGAVGDAFCNPYIISDVSTMGIQPADVVNTLSDSDLGTDGNGVPVVKEDSTLAKYIIYCGERSSPFGTIDQNIAGEVDKAGNVGGKVGSAIIGAIPIVGDVFDVASNKQKLNNVGWISGSSCVTGAKKEGDKTADWNERSRYYQRFIEDQRLAESEGIIEESAVTKFISSYYEKNPIDTSFEGQLARYSGQTKETVEATIALFELSEWLADYNPSELFPYYNADDKIHQTNDEIQFEQNGVIANREIDYQRIAPINRNRFSYNITA